MFPPFLKGQRSAPCFVSEMSGGLAPSKSTVYVSNLPYELTNNDLYKIFEKYGKLGKVTIMKDKLTRESKGVAFVLFVDRQSAHRAVQAMNRKELFGRTLKCSIAKDNGRASEFIRRRIYKDKSRCYECGEFGHLSFRCPKNALGDREQPLKKKKVRGEKDGEEVGERGKGRRSLAEEEEEEEEEDMEEEEDDDLSLREAIRLCHDMRERELTSYGGAAGSSSFTEGSGSGYHIHLDEFGKRKTIKPDSYFSDEDASD